MENDIRRQKMTILFMLNLKMPGMKRWARICMLLMAVICLRPQLRAADTKTTTELGSVSGNKAAKPIDHTLLAGKKIVFLGDSITQSGSQAGGYVTFTTYFLEKRHPQEDFDIYGIGLASETLSGLSETNHAGGKFPRPCLFERLGRLIEKVNPDIVFACYGMNDGIYLPLDPGRFLAFKNGVVKLVEQTKAAGVQEVFLITPPIYDFVSPAEAFNYDSVLTAYAAWEMTLNIPGVRVIDLHTVMRQARDARSEVFSKDRVHPGEDGHLLMAKTILTAVGEPPPEATMETIHADPLFKLEGDKCSLKSVAWMYHVGFTRATIVAPQPLGKKGADVVLLQEKVNALRRQK